MDGISAGASVLAFVAAAVQTSRAVYNIVSSVRSGSPDMRNLVSSASSLERTLQQLLSLLDSQPQLDSSEHLVALENSVRQCGGDLDSICQLLWRLGNVDGIGRAQKAWRMVKVAIKRDDIQRMSRVIQHHVSILTLQVVILPVEKDLDIPQFARHSPGQTRDEKSRVTRRPRQETAATLLAIRNKLDHLPASTSSQFIATMSVLEDIELQVEVMPNAAESPQVAVGGCLAQDDPESLGASLQRLSQLAHEESRAMHSMEAEDIAEDIDVLISALLAHHEPERSLNRKRKHSDSDFQAVESERPLKLIKNIVNTSNSIRVNPEGSALLKYTSNSPKAVERRNDTYVLPHGRASVSTKITKALGSSKGSRYDDATTQVFSATLEYLPSSNFAYAKIVASVVHRAGLFGSTTLYPSLTVSPIVPAQSEVFAAIKTGDLTGLKSLLQEGRASLKDCDPQGRSLLGYACFNDKPAICKFLLENGANGDAVENTESQDGQYEYLPLLLHCGIHDPTLECQRLLLASGADPSEANEDELGPFELALYNPVLLRYISHYARDLINTEERDSGGDTLLLRFIHRYIYNPRALQFLLDLGADVHARTLGGNTCLHLCLRKACRYLSDLRYDDLLLLPSLFMLIRAGADVSAVNWSGESVSYTALATFKNEDDPETSDVGSFLMDAWLTVLKKCGYQPLEIMCDVALSHKVRFTAKYRQEHYEAMQKWEPWMSAYVSDRETREWVEQV
ncbi:hypothetical protein H2200_002782 [Cladophialophora chaetospira]|uniref:Azaphilone pigments biosynthesis cluster protein L N-terminal domain-containing protein n=1 Tax=Cladophialophora chaetospira TaxID=386627 RepID=A0AA39CNW5_9EURO|nr:hypothetical protein H2200_002782 [Cladophialophora chaetospira]